MSRFLTATAEKWHDGRISIFALLMKLNKYAGRSHKDLARYPVFPWVISDYASESLDLNNPGTLRDLSRPVGALSEPRLSEPRVQKEDSRQMGGNYGSFYSSAAVVIGYLIRMEPFTTLHVSLQSSRFDHADRLFVSIPVALNNITTFDMHSLEADSRVRLFPRFPAQ